MTLAHFRCPNCRAYGYLPENETKCPRCQAELICEPVKPYVEPVSSYSECPFCEGKAIEKDAMINQCRNSKGYLSSWDFGYRCLDPECQAEWKDDEPEEIPTEEVDIARL
jgi:RecJ-like exonuclease